MAGNPAFSNLTIREFLPGDELAFKQLNEEWITRYFTLEPTDEKMLGDPRGAILDPGGRIFFALLDGRPVGCCALLAAAPNDYEVVKMAVTEACRNAGIGRKLLAAVIAAARTSGAVRLHLETNGILATA